MGHWIYFVNDYFHVSPASQTDPSAETPGILQHHTRDLTG